MTAVLRTEDLSVRFRIPRGLVSAVTEVSFSLQAGRLLALVGESGCGKSVLASALLGLLPANADLAGAAWLRDAQGELELTGAQERMLSRTVCGRRVALVPQSAHAALTPTRTIRSQLEETLKALQGKGSVRELAERAGFPAEAFESYPHELSGGMAQRAVLALALAGLPLVVGEVGGVVIADEPTTGLDRPLVDRVVDELHRLTEDGIAVLLITHDLAAARRVATDLAVMYASRLVELGPAAEVLADPWHTYTQDLLNALPDKGFLPIPGHPPDLTALPEGCAYAVRSERHRATCDGSRELRVVGSRSVACGMGAAC